MPFGSLINALPPSYRFSPEVIEVDAGTMVTWHNSDKFTHSAEFPDRKLTQLTLQPGESGGITFSKAGEYDYECSFYPGDMTGKVIVTTP